MVLAEDVLDRYQLISLPCGVVLSQEHLQQLAAHGIEFICIREEDTRSDHVVAQEAAESAKAALDIFANADLADPVMAALFDQVLLYRSK